MQSQTIPGDIMKTTIILGLTLKELGVLFGSPLIMILPATYIEQIPISLTLGFVLICMPVIIYLILQTPDGQAPISWIGAMINRRVKPDRYTLEPSEGRRADAKYLDVVHTADKLVAENQRSDSPRNSGQEVSTDGSGEKNGTMNTQTTDQ